MPELLALEWDSDQVSGLLATVGPGSVRVKKCVQFRRPGDWNTIPPGEAGAWLKDRLLEAGVRCDKVLVALPRADVVMKRLEVPDVPDAELPTLVRFQAAAKAAQALDDLYLDFLPTPRREGAPREVLVSTCTRETAQQIRGVCEAAGLHLVSLGVTPVALSEIVARVDPPDADDSAATVVISRHGPRLEVFVLRREVLIFSHATRLREDYTAHEQQQATVGEISRALVALRGVNAGLKIRRAWLLAGFADNSALLAALPARLGCEVKTLDPFTTVALVPNVAEPADVSWFAGPIGLLLAKSGAKVPGIDFLAPRQPAAKRDPRRARFALAGGVAAALLALGGAWYGWEYYRLSGLVEERLQQDRELAAFVKEGEPTLKSADALKKWTDGQVAWLDQFQGLADHLPSTDRIYLSRLELTKPQTGDTLGRVTLKGYARDRTDVTGLNDRLMTDASPYRLMPQVIRPSKDEPYYDWYFESEILIDPPKAKKVAEKTPTEAGHAKPEPSRSAPSKPATDSKSPAASSKTGAPATNKPNQPDKPASQTPMGTSPPAGKSAPVKPDALPSKAANGGSQS